MLRISMQRISMPAYGILNPRIKDRANLPHEQPFRRGQFFDQGEQFL